MKIRKLGAILGILAMLSLLAVPAAVFAATDDSDTTTVAGNPTATIETTITGNITSWDLTVPSSEDLTSIDMNVKCNSGTWTVKVKDALDDSKPAGSVGKMAAWNGTAYVASGEVMETAIQVSSNVTGSYVSLNSSAQQIESSTATPTGGNSYDIGIKQTVNYGDLVLSSPDVYRITITFESNIPV